MPKPRPNAAREADRRARAAAARPPSRPADIHPEVWEVMQREGCSKEHAYAILAGPEHAAARVRAAAAALRRHELERSRLLGERDQAVELARVAGASWNVLARAAGTTRQALMERARR